MGNEFASIVLFPTSPNPRRDASSTPTVRKTPLEGKRMFSDKIDYTHPELMPYSDGSDAELLYSVLLAAAFAVGFLLAVFG